MTPQYYTARHGVEIPTFIQRFSFFEPCVYGHTIGRGGPPTCSRPMRGRRARGESFPWGHSHGSTALGEYSVSSPDHKSVHTIYLQLQRFGDKTVILRDYSASHGVQAPTSRVHHCWLWGLWSQRDSGRIGSHPWIREPSIHLQLQ